jgi:hypothetical protein
MSLRRLFAALALFATGAQAAELRGLLDIRAVDADASRSFVDGGLGKTRYDAGSPRLSVGQAVLRGDMDLTDTIAASADISADDKHHGVVDVREAWIEWSPVPSSEWKTRVKAGFFFPPSSVEADYNSIGWVPKYTISSSAINSWIGEELRTNGAEWSARRLGRYVGAPYDVGFVASVFTGNDPTGTLLSWRGWSISDRMAGRNEALPLADLPVYRPDGPLRKQSRIIHPFRELDGRLGYYAGMNFNAGRQLELAYLHYDNRADPLVVKNGQWGWLTRFDHVSAVWKPVDGPAGGWEFMAQAMRGDTLMGMDAVYADFQSWYLLAAHRLGPGTLALRYDRFSTTEEDKLPQDPNDEHGQGVALAYNWPLARNLALMTEWLDVRSERGARLLIGERPRQVERSLTVSLRWHF